MLPPSALVLVNRVDIYRATNATDLDGGYTPTYALVRRSVPCTVQNDGTSEIVDDMTGHRITEGNTYLVMFSSDQSVRPRDKLIWRNNLGESRTLFVQGSEDCAGRAAAFAVKAIEKI